MKGRYATRCAINVQNFTAVLKFYTCKEKGIKETYTNCPKFDLAPYILLMSAEIGKPLPRKKDQEKWKDRMSSAKGILI